MFRKLGSNETNMVPMLNCPEGRKVGQIRSRGNCNFNLLYFHGCSTWT